MNKICRICLEEGVLSSIFTKNFNISLSEMIEYCCNIKIRKDDGMPEQLCSNCTYKLGVAYHFKQTSESADSRLRQYLGLTMPPRNADVAVMTDPVNTPVSTVLRCICKKSQRKPNSNYRRKEESEKLKRGPKPKPKQVHNCYQCDKEFKCSAQLEMHVRTHTGDKPFLCMYCPRSFTQKHNLTIHLRVHTGEKPYQCEICSKTFSAQGNLQTHIKIHTGQRNHVCHICNKTFITSSEVTRHMSKHSGIKDFKCEICGSAFVQFRDLKLHKQKKHQVPPQKKEDPKIIPDETINPNDDIDIEDVSKTIVPHTIKEHLPHNILNMSTPGPPILSMKTKSEPKEIFNNFSNQNVTCNLCGQHFEYLSLLAQHYSQKHEHFQAITPS